MEVLDTLFTFQTLDHIKVVSKFSITIRSKMCYFSGKLVVCEICYVPVTQKNVNRHYRLQHGGTVSNTFVYCKKSANEYGVFIYHSLLRDIIR